MKQRYKIFWRLGRQHPITVWTWGGFVTFQKDEPIIVRIE